MTNLISGERYASFASVSLDRWEQLRGCIVFHVERGYGEIKGVDPRRGNPLLTIMFDGSGEPVQFNLSPFAAGRIQVELPSSALIQKEYVAWLESEREMERVERENEANRLDRLENERIAQAAEHKRKEDFLKGLRVKYGRLIDKFEAPEAHMAEGDIESPLPGILLKFQSMEALNNDELAWLEQKRLFRMMAIDYFLQYKRSANLWHLVKTSKYLRKAHLPDKSLQVSEGCSAESGSRAWSALQTSRAAAFRDLGQHKDAISTANTAISEDPRSYHPHILLGALYYDLSEYEKGDYHFNQAEKLGAVPRMRDQEIRNKLRKSPPNDQERLIAHLLDLDHERYAWVKSFENR